MGRVAGDGARRLARWMLAYSEVMAIASLLAGPPLVGLLIDSQLGVAPWGVVVGACLGVVLGIVKLTSWSESLSRRSPHSKSRPSLPSSSRDPFEGGSV
jgi:F0F1-type ATP synthase assembly protein I